MTPRSAKIANDVSGRSTQAGSSSRNIRATSSCSCECRAFSSRSRSPARHRATRSTRTSSARATLRIVSSDSWSRWPRSTRETVDGDTFAALARSTWRHRFFSRTDRTTDPNRWSSIRLPMVRRRTYRPVIWRCTRRPGITLIHRTQWQVDGPERPSGRSGPAIDPVLSEVAVARGSRPIGPGPAITVCPWSLCRSARLGRPARLGRSRDPQTEHLSGIIAVHDPWTTAASRWTTPCTTPPRTVDTRPPNVDDRPPSVG